MPAKEKVVLTADEGEGVERAMKTQKAS